ncbi:hypothetical protein CK203_011428 [Vitis vinifera]|uniref:Uncharacterized protein n=1 Tax=Vitis vinifera TaxID=29760 RepID=A0A438JYT5_VITVI|nr:hypothetical protein CK203_011428 [Vitis vinifera]
MLSGLGLGSRSGFTSLDQSRWEIDSVSRRELEGLRQRSDEFISSFISHWQGKIAEIVDRPLQRDDSVLMVIRGLIRDPKGKFQTQLERTLFHQGVDPRGRCMVDGFRWKSILRANQCGSAKEVLC